MSPKSNLKVDTPKKTPFQEKLSPKQWGVVFCLLFEERWHTLQSLLLRWVHFHDRDDTKSYTRWYIMRKKLTQFPSRPTNIQGTNKSLRVCMICFLWSFIPNLRSLQWRNSRRSISTRIHYASSLSRYSKWTQIKILGGLREWVVRVFKEIEVVPLQVSQHLTENLTIFGQIWNF